MPTHLCAAIILNFRNGIKKPQLLKRLQWLRMEVTRRGGQVILVEGTPRNYLVDRPIKMLGDLIAERRHEFLFQIPKVWTLEKITYPWDYIETRFYTCFPRKLYGQ